MKEALAALLAGRELPGDVMELRVKIAKRKMSLWRFECECYVGGDKASEAIVTATAAPAASSADIPDELPAPPARS